MRAGVGGIALTFGILVGLVAGPAPYDDCGPGADEHQRETCCRADPGVAPVEAAVGVDGDHPDRSGRVFLAIRRGLRELSRQGRRRWCRQGGHGGRERQAAEDFGGCARHVRSFGRVTYAGQSPRGR